MTTTSSELKLKSQTRGIVRALSPKQIGAVYVLIVAVIVFSLISPSEFGSFATAKIIVNQYSISGIVGLALLLPLAAGTFDLSVGSCASLSGVVSAYWLAHVGADPAAAVAVGLVCAIGVGVVNSVVVVVLGIDSFIGTLATMGIFEAIATALGGNTTITQNVNGAFQNDIGLRSIGGFTIPVFVFAAVAVLLYVALQMTASGRRVYAIGFDSEVARLGGVRVEATRVATLVLSAFLAGLAGILETSTIGAGDPTIGSAYLLPAFAVAFLGSTQLGAGRINVWGTVIAVLLLGTGNVGLLIVGGPSWSPDVFDGLILIIAVGLTSTGGSLRERTTALRRVRRGKERAAEASSDA